MSALATLELRTNSRRRCFISVEVASFALTRQRNGAARKASAESRTTPSDDVEQSDSNGWLRYDVLMSALSEAMQS